MSLERLSQRSVLSSKVDIKIITTCYILIVTNRDNYLVELLGKAIIKAFKLLFATSSVERDIVYRTDMQIRHAFPSSFHRFIVPWAVNFV